MIYIFKTSVKSKNSIKVLTPQLNEIEAISSWNFDLDDCDNILRIDSQSDIVENIIKILSDFDYKCEELND
ncbi:hypothetical protein G5B37_03920 [Rasiella rasia]|uniref:Uncharacterized protein n=1 Tax=Rasiella rasia TaxID=2744027 RepID=A0A6G6GJN4_9FLAO|nr:hypothetical protein [Rasiella rasia]QIE58737.1 hypothetical protein G5B37_03920 [Rasiella rasia]